MSQMPVTSKASSMEFREDDRIIAVMGPTGVGKSTFIANATGQAGQGIGHRLRSCTSEIRIVRCRSYDHRQVVLVDTPGFDDTYMSDVEVLSIIAAWLAETFKERRTLTGVLYLHRITDNRLSGPSLNSFEVFNSMCGDRVADSVVLVTTMWDQVNDEQGSRREEELRDKFWKPMLEPGAHMRRFQGTEQSALEIIDSIINTKPEAGEDGRATTWKDPARREMRPLLIQEEMIIKSYLLNQTTAGKTLYNALDRLMREYAEKMSRLRQRADRQVDEAVAQQLNERCAEIEKEIRQTKGQLLQLRISLTQRLKSLLRLRGVVEHLHLPSLTNHAVDRP